MNDDDPRRKVEKLIDKAVEVADSQDALRFSQAALNAAHVKHALAERREVPWEMP